MHQGLVAEILEAPIMLHLLILSVQKATGQTK